MHRRGHVGVALLAYAPIGFFLLRERQLTLALLGLFGVLAIEPLPDNDMWIPGLRHRGTSHSLFCALLVGGVIGTLGWLIGGWVAEFLIALDASAVGIFASVFQVVGEQLRGLDENALSTFGFAVGFFGIFVHLLADALTVSGIRPFLPVARWQLSLSHIRADSPTANSALLALGVLAIAVVAVATAPGAAFAFDGDLSPVGVAAGQSANQTGNQSAASVTFSNQTTNGSTVTIESAQLPNGGFIAVHGGGYATGPAPPDSSIIATSQYLSPGNYTNIAINISHAPPGNSPGLNRSQLNNSQTLAAVVYNDTNNNRRMDFVRSFGKNDTAYISNGNPVSDTAGVTVPSSEKRQQASVTVRNQSLRGDSVTVESATLPEGGFLVVHNESYLPPENAPLESAVGITSYLEPGQYNGVSVPLLDGAVARNQTLVAVPYRDTNDNERYDYIASDGFQDVAYENRTGNQTVIINDTARAVVSGSESALDESEGTTAPANTSTPFRITNLSVSNRTARIDDEITVTARIENPTNSRLEDELALATAGKTAETQDVALFPRESRAVTFTQSYDTAGEYVIKVGNRTERIRIVEEGAPLTTTTPPNATVNGSAESSEAMGLTIWPMLVLGAILVAAIVWGYRKMRGRDRRPR